jgi:hypothetical protein
MLKFVGHRIGDNRILRLLRKWLRAGVSEDGQWSKTQVGTPQGSVISPLLANVYLHYVFDLWVHRVWRAKLATGDMIVVRYADDFIVGFQHRGDAERFLHELRERLQTFGLALHPDKTRLIEFGRFAASNRQRRGEGRPETFDFLGFTHYCGRTKKGNRFIVWRKTIGKRLRTKIQSVAATLRKMCHASIADQGRWLHTVVKGWLNYFAVPGNYASLETFVRELDRHWLRTLRRRGDRRKFTWERFAPIAKYWIPRPRILHPYPNARFRAKYLT